MPSAELLSSPLLALHQLRHGFATRRGGVSKAPYDQLNLVAKWGDEPHAVQTNLDRFAEAGGFSLDRMMNVRQVHGANVVMVDERTSLATLRETEADAMVSASPGLALAISTADCVPILLADTHAKVVGAAHAGWRGTAAGIAGATVAAMQALGAEPERIVAAMGPHICQDCFEVGDEVAVHFTEVVRPSGGKAHVDLYRENALRLYAAGVRELGARPPCTMCEPERFFSFRRDQGKTGGHLSFIMLT